MNSCMDNIKSKKIAVVSYINSHGGSIRILTWLANELAKDNDVTFINMSGTAMFYTLSEKVRQINVSYEKKRRELARVLHREKFEAVINFGDHAIYELVILKPFLGYKVFVSHRSSIYPNMRPQDYFRLNVIYSFCDAIVLLTKETAKYFDRGLTKRKKRYVIPNPIEIKNENEWKNNNGRNIICVARISIKEKGHDLLIRAMKTVVEYYPDAHLFLYGEEANNDLTVINRMISELNLGDNVTYCGVTEQVCKKLCDADLQVLSSNFEGIPNALIEGISVGIPIVTTDFFGGGARLLLGENGEGGCIVKSGSSELMAQAIINYFQDRNEAIEKTKVAKKIAESFSVEKIGLMWRKIFEDAFV